MATREVEVVDMAAAAVAMEVVQAVIACLTSEPVYRSKAGVRFMAASLSLVHNLTFRRSQHHAKVREVVLQRGSPSHKPIRSRCRQVQKGTRHRCSGPRCPTTCGDLR